MTESYFAGVTCAALDMIGVLVLEDKLISKGFVEHFGDRLALPITEIKDRYDAGFARGGLTRDQFWEGVLEGDWRRAEEEFLATRNFAPQAREVIAQLSACVAVAVISDMPRDWATALLKRHGVTPLLSGAVFSSDGVGSKKDGGLFDALCEAVKRPAQQILLVDDRVSNVERATARGMRAMWLPLDSDEEQSPDVHRLSNLFDLPGLLGCSNSATR